MKKNLRTFPRKLPKIFLSLKTGWNPPNPFKVVRNQKGVALLLATFSLTLMLYLAMETQYDTQVEYTVNNAAVNQLKAYYAAKSGVELSLLRIKIYQQAKAQVANAGQAAAGIAPMLNLIWSFPFKWPPILPDDMNAVNKDEINASVKAATLDGGYFTTISDEGTKIDINDLASPSKALRDSTRKLLLQIFENEIQNETEWGKKNRDYRAEELIDDITDWVDSDRQMVKGGDESSRYESNDAEVRYPPNRQFRTIEELRLVHGMTDEIFELLEKRVTVYGAKSINPNTASSEVLQSIHPTITSEIAGAVIARRQDSSTGGPFRSPDDFWSFIGSRGARIEPEVVANTPILVDSTFNFRIKSVGDYGNSAKEIEAIVFDIPNSAKAIAELVKKEATPTPGVSPTPTPTQTTGQQTQSATKGPPRIVYWFER